MKKFLAISVLLSLCGVLLCVGCGGGSSGGIIAALTGVIAVAAIFSAGPAGSAAAFAANIRAATTTNKYKAKIVVTSPISYATETTNLELANNNKELRVNFNLNIQRSNKIEYKVCLYPANDSNSDPLLIAYNVTSLDSDTKQETITINSNSTAKALAYEKWKENKQNVYYNNFNPDPSSINEVETRIQTVLNSKLNVANLQNFKWQTEDNTIISKLNEIANDTPTPAQNSNIVTGVIKLEFLKQEMIIKADENNNPKVTILNFGDGHSEFYNYKPDIVGLRYCSTHPPQLYITLGNFYFLNFLPNAPNTEVIRYMPGVKSLDEVKVATDTYNHHAFGGDMSTVISKLQKDQVYCFVIDGYYGALKILEVISPTLNDEYPYQTGQTFYIKFQYKFNKNKGDKNLADTNTFAASFR